MRGLRPLQAGISLRQPLTRLALCAIHPLPQGERDEPVHLER